MRTLDTRKEQIKALDLRSILASEIAAKGKNHAKYDTYACPLHKEKHGQALAVYNDHWTCFGACQTSGDAISFVMAYHNMDFMQAIGYLSERYLSGTLAPQQPPQRRAATGPVHSEPPPSEWQAAARDVIRQGMANLANSKALDYLRGRGLTDETIASAQLGYIPGKPDEWRQIAGLKVPCGVLIPWLAGGAVWGLKVRRAAGTPKYVQVAGGNIKGCLYLADNIQAGKSLVLTEGEFDALIVQQLADGWFSAAALGSASNHKINARWYPRLMSTKLLYLLMDDDSAGQHANDALGTITAAARRLVVPAPHKDINEMLTALGTRATTNWLDDYVR